MDSQLTTAAAALLAHLEPVPPEDWQRFIGDCLALPGYPAPRELQRQEALRTWLLGYRNLRAFHFQADRQSLNQDRRASSGSHPEIWRYPDWASQAEQFVAAGIQAQKIKAHKRGVVCRVPGPEGDPLILKHFPLHKRRDPRNRMGYSKAIFSLHAAEALNRRGLPAAIPYAAWSTPQEGAYMLMENLAGHISLQQAVLQVEGPHRATLLEHLATFARRMHLLGVAYRDFKPSNILVDLHQPGLDAFALIDHDRNRFRRGEIGPARVRRDLAALHAGLPQEVRASERIRALRQYGSMPGQFPCNWGYSGALWKQQIPKLVAEAQRRDRAWRAHRILGGRP
jgi:lipopolysaccharide kinase (Kdo/WaaP) family protein